MNVPPPQELARLLPDIPRWVEARAMLLSGDCRLFGVRDGDARRFVVCNRERELIAIVGRPEPGAIVEAAAFIGNCGNAISSSDCAEYVAGTLQGWKHSPAALHLLGREPRLPEVPRGAVRLLAPEEIPVLDHLPASLKRELTIVASVSPIAATLVDELPVSFCYAAWETEGLWDISIDTLSEHRGRGYAAVAVAFLIEQMSRKGKRPVWGSEESNTASMKLAAKLGFVVVDRLSVFHSPDS
jgi:RimJ/RimL family protein N-acetyltransferase